MAIEIDSYVEIGDRESSDYDFGRVLDIDDDRIQASVGWYSGARTAVMLADLTELSPAVYRAMREWAWSNRPEW